MRKFNFLGPVSRLTLALGSLVLGIPAAIHAQGLEEVMVTATRRTETDIQTTPVSVTAISAATIDKLLIHDLSDVAAAVPNLVSGNAPAFASFNPSLRGVGKDGIILYEESPVGVSVDDFVLPHVQTQALEPSDIEAIEVLRGPQGTLFGKNTTAGVINVRTKRPQLNERSIDVKGSYAEFDSWQTNYAGNYGGETWAVRASGVYQKSDGYYKAGKSSTTYDPVAGFGSGDFSPRTFAGDGSHLGGDDVFSGRFKGLWQPNDQFNALFQYEMIRDNGESQPTVNTSPSAYVFPLIGFPGVSDGDPIKQTAVSSRNDFFSLEDGNQIDVDGFYLNMEYRFSDLRVDSVTGYRDQKSRIASTYMGEAYTSLFDASRDDNRDTFQQEIRLSSEFDGPWNFVTGAFYQSDDTKFCVTQILGLIDFFGPGPEMLNAALAGSGLPTLANGYWNANASILCNRQDATAIAAFADATFDFTDKLQIGVGVRQSYEKKKWAGRPQTLFQFLNGTATADETLFASLDENLDAADFGRFPFNVAREEQSWTDPSFRATIGYKATDTFYTWATFAHSYKSGMFNDQTGTYTAGLPFPFGNPLQLQPIDPESADSVELGLKTDLMDDRLRLNIVYFDVIYSDAQRQLNAQIPLPGGGSFQETLFFNAAKLNAKGIEFESTFVVTDQLTLAANFSYQDVDFSKFQADTNFDGVIDVDLSGNDVNRSPPWTAFASATYDHTLGGYGNASHNMYVSFVDKTIFTYSALGPDFDAYTDAHTLLNWSSTFTDNSGNYYLRVFGKNLLDERYKTGNLSVATLWTMSSYGAPQQFGVEVGAHFDF